MLIRFKVFFSLVLRLCSVNFGGRHGKIGGLHGLLFQKWSSNYTRNIDLLYNEETSFDLLAFFK